MTDFPYTEPLAATALDQLFLKARTINKWTDKPVTDEQITQLYDLLKMGPTSANCSPARFVFIKSNEAKQRLLSLVSEGNRDKVAAAPVTVIIASDPKFAEKLPFLFPHNLDAKNWFAAPAVAEDTYRRNGTLQGAYLMLAARSLGLHCGPMSGFDKAGVDKEFFANSGYLSNFICALGYGRTEEIFDRSPRLPFDEAAEIL